MTSPFINLFKGCLMALACSFMPWSLQAEEVKYDFDHLSDGFLPKRDDWIICLNVCYPKIVAGEGTDSTQVLTIGGGAGGVMRPMEKPPFKGNETKARLEADIQWSGPAQEERSTTLGLAVADEFKAKPSIQSITPRIGLFSIFSKVKNAPVNHFIVVVQKAGKEVFLRAPLPESVKPGDWLRLRLEMNFSENGGDGHGVLLFKNLTQNENSFSPCGLDNIALGVKELPGKASQPSNWNAWVIRLVNATTDGPTGFAIDNLVAGSE